MCVCIDISGKTTVEHGIITKKKILEDIVSHAHADMLAKKKKSCPVSTKLQSLLNS